MTQPPSLAFAFKRCRLIQKKYATNYYLATLLFPRELRNATYALYAFVRVPDEIVDEPDGKSPSEVRALLEGLFQKWKRAERDGQSDDPVLHAAAHTFRTYAIPSEYADAFYEAMRMDIEPLEYRTYADLQRYMYGSASVVGLMMSHAIGFTDARALDAARALGEAMQLTNFLRDLDDDFRSLGRIYVPMEDLNRFGVTREHIAERRFDDSLRALMKFQVDRARALYDESEAGIALLHPRGRKAVRLASRLYAAILNKIEANDYNPFAGRARTSGLEKAGHALSVLLARS